MILGHTKYRVCTIFICVLLSAISLYITPCTGQTSSQSKSSFATQSAELVYVIKLHGTVGKIPGDNDTACTADSLKASLDAAAKAKATIVVLDIEGPGGLVTQMRYMVKVLLDAQVNGIRIVAFPRDAFSAWSIIALACKEIVVTPTTRMGAAVTIKRQGDGFVEAPEEKDAVSQKFAAPWNALCRQVTDLTKRSPAIAEAMQLQQSELWWSPTKGFSATKGSGNDWEQLDDGVTVLCLTGAEMLKTKIALGEVKSIDQIPALLHCAPGTQILLSNKSSNVSKSVTVSKETKSEDDKCRKACERIRQALDLANIPSVFVLDRNQNRVWSDYARLSIKRTKVRFVKEPGDNPFAHQVNEEYHSDEDNTERAERIKSILLKVMNKLPTLKQTDCAPDFPQGIDEIRTLLKEAIKALKENAMSAAHDRIETARGIMKNLADAY